MSEVEEKAKAQGWTPKEDFKGDPEKWRSAEEFLAVGEKVAAVQSERNSKLLEKVERLESTITDLTKSQREFQEQQFKVIKEARQEAYQKAIADLEKKKKKAVEEGDLDEYERLTDEEKSIKKPEDPKQPTEQQVSPEFNTWLADNTWYMNKPDLQIAADVYAAALQKKEQNLSPAEFYKRVGNYIKRVFKDDFETQKPPSIDDSDTKPRQQTGKKGYDDLPKEARLICDKQVKDGLFKNKQEYVDLYFEE